MRGIENVISSRGKLFRLISVWPTKPRAQKAAKSLKKDGYETVVRKCGQAGNWGTYGRKR